MCVQCMLTATTAGAAATGARSWLATRDYRWLTPRRLRRATAAIMLVALCVVAAGPASSHPAAGAQARPAAHQQQR